MRILFSGLLLFCVINNTNGMLQNYAKTNLGLDLAVNLPTALLLAKTALPQYFAMIPCTPVGVGAQCVQLGIQLSCDYLKYHESNKSYERPHTAKTPQRDIDRETFSGFWKMQFVKSIFLGLIYSVALAYNGHFTSRKHWEEVGKYFLMTQIWAVIPFGILYNRTR